MKLEWDKSSWTGFFAGIAISFFITALILTGIVFLLIDRGTNLPSARRSGEIPAVQEVPAPATAPQIPNLAMKPAPQPPPDKRSPVRGPANAMITLDEYTDFHCPFCKRAESTIDQIVKNYPTQIKQVFHHFPLPMHQGADRTHEASVCAQDQGKFWEYKTEIFALAQAPQQADLEQIAKKIGLNTNQFLECLNSGKYKGYIQEEISAGSQRGVSGTPAFYLNGQQIGGAQPYENFDRIIQGILTGKAPVAPAAQPQLPPPPTNVQFDDLQGRPSMGPENAPITLVEFSDFHCPFCARVGPTVEQLMKNYAGKIRRVWRQFPLAMHQGADRTAEASECAFEQKKFWEYHDRLFATQGQSRDDAALIKIADDLKLNKGNFEKCLADGKYKEVVQKDMAKGNQSGVSGTPAVFINGQLISGAQPYESFDRIIQSKLKA